MADVQLTCKDCQNPFTWTEGEQEFYKQKQFSQPVRCQKCRQAKRQQRDNRDYGDNDRGSGGYNRGGRY